MCQQRGSYHRESATLSARQIDGLSNHRILISSNIGTTRAAEIKNTIDLRTGFRTSKITRHEKTEIFCKRDAEITGAPARTLLHFIIQRDLRS